MRMLFQTIGVLVQYNWALPYYLSTLREGIKVDNLTNLFSYLMGGYYYHLRSLGKITPIFEETGIKKAKTLDRIFKAIHTKRLVMKKNYDIIHLNHYDEELLTKNPPKIFTLHGSLDEPNPNTCNMLRKIQKYVNTIVAPTNHSAKTVKEACGINVKVIHHGVNTEIFNPYIISKHKAKKILKLPSNKRIVLWVARISPEKNLEMALKVLEKVIKERKDIVLIVKGRAIDQSYMSKIRLLIKKLGIERYVLFDLKWIPNMMMYYYRASDVYIHTSVTEAFGLTVAEAMACGTPVIAYRKSAVPEVVGDAGYLVDDVEEFAEKVLELLSDEKLQRYIGLKGVKRVHERFSLKNTASKYLQLYKSL